MKFPNDKETGTRAIYFKVSLYYITITMLRCVTVQLGLQLTEVQLMEGPCQPHGIIYAGEFYRLVQLRGKTCDIVGNSLTTEL